MVREVELTERLPWFRCFPSRLLGALAGMGPEEGYLYVTLLMRIYENGGPVDESSRSLSRRTGFSERKITAALATLTASGKIVRLEDGRLDSDKTHEELEWQNDRRDDQSRAGLMSAEKRSDSTPKRREKRETEKAKQNQRNASTTAELPFNHLEEEEEEESQEASPPSTRAWPDRAFDRWYADYPHKVGRQAAENAFERVKKSGKASFADLVAGLQRYVASKPHDRSWCNPATWLNQGRWDDRPSAPSATGPPGHRRSNHSIDVFHEYSRQVQEERRGTGPDTSATILDLQPAERRFARY
jgi:hypothetical protein